MPSDRPATQRRRTRPSDNDPLFIVGAPRSGTTLLYHIMLSTGEFPVYMAESKVLDCWGRYGSLDDETNRERFLADFLTSRQFARSGLDAAEFRQKVARRVENYTDFLRLLMDEMARDQGKDRWIEKTPDHVWHLHRLAEAFENAKFIHLVRDGRDVALSIRRLGWTRTVGPNRTLQLVAAGKWWETDVARGRCSGVDLGDRYLEVRYEDLVEELDQTMLSVRAFAGIRSRIPLDEPDRPDYVGSSNSAFDAPTEGISTAAVGRWRRRLEDDEAVNLCHAIADPLDRLGYGGCDLSGDPDTRTQIFARSYGALRKLWRLLKSRTPLARVASVPLEIGME